MTGAPTDTTPALDRARELLDLASQDPRAAVDAATELLGELEDTGDYEAMAATLRARGLGWSKLDDFDVEAAVRDLDAAVKFARRGRDPVVLGEVRMTEAGLLAFSGDTSRALAAISESVDLLAGPKLARALVQRSTILYRAGRLREAMTDLDQAAPVIESSDDPAWLAHLYSNRGIVLGAHGDAASAERALTHAHTILSTTGRHSAAAEALHNLGWVASIAGDIPMALRYFDQAEAEYERLGHGRGEVWRDRSEALMSAHLTSEARQLATRAVDSLGTGFGAAHAEALIYLARAAMLDGDNELGHAAASDAADRFERQDRPVWAALARYLAIQARSSSGEMDEEDLTRVAAIGAALEEAGLVRESVQARLLLMRLAVETGALDVADEVADVAEAAHRSGPVDLRVGAWLSLAVLRRAKGNERGAVSAARAGLAVVDSHRASLGASEMRVAVAGHARELAILGLGAAYRSGRPERIFTWMERTRAGALRFAAVRPPADAELAADLARIRRLEREYADDPSAGGHLEEERIRLQETVRRRSLTLRGEEVEAGTELEIGDLVGRLGDTTLIEIGRFDGIYRGLRISEKGATYRPLASEADVAAALDTLRFGLSRLAQRRGSPASREAARAMVQAAGAELQHHLLDPLGAVDGPMLMVPPAELHAVPWALLPALVGVPVTVAPSSQLWFQRSHAPQRRRRGTLVAHGPLLPGAALETRTVAGLHRGVTRLTSRQSRVEAVMAGLDGARLAHLVAHGSFRSDNPLFSSLRMADGGLTVYDLERIDRMPPVMVLSACNSGLQAVRPGSETMGIVAALLAAGCRTVVASTGLVPDTSRTARTMVEFHRLLVSGSAPAVALAEAQMRALGGGAEGPAAAPFVCFGVG